jgi:hypothetical protein
LLVPECESDRSFVGSVGIAASTDNQGNSRMIEKHMTTKLPLAYVLLELSSRLQARSMVLDLRWLARDLNQPADDLTNFRFDDFTAALRVPVVWSEINFKVLHLLGNEAIGFSEALETLRGTTQGMASRAGGRTALSEKLGVRDPW